MTPRLPQLREDVANAITFHPGNRTGTPEQRRPVSLMLADTVLRIVRPCTCDGDLIECSHKAARGQAEEENRQLRAERDALKAELAEASRSRLRGRDGMLRRVRSAPTAAHHRGDPLSGYRITLYEDGPNGAVLPPFVMPTLPYPSLRIDHAAGMWEVLRVQLHIPAEGSITQRENRPLMVQVAVRAAAGIHATEETR